VGHLHPWSPLAEEGQGNKQTASGEDQGQEEVKYEDTWEGKFEDAEEGEEEQIKEEEEEEEGGEYEEADKEEPEEEEGDDCDEYHDAYEHYPSRSNANLCR